MPIANGLHITLRSPMNTSAGNLSAGNCIQVINADAKPTEPGIDTAPIYCELVGYKDARGFNLPYSLLVELLNQTPAPEADKALSMAAGYQCGDQWTPARTLLDSLWSAEISDPPVERPGENTPISREEAERAEAEAARE